MHSVRPRSLRAAAGGRSSSTTESPRVNRRNDTPIVELTGITKAFPGVLANDAVDLKLWSGEVHCLLGENGAGKSTLIGILSGLIRPDAGTIRIEGVETVDLVSAQGARARDRHGATSTRR